MGERVAVPGCTETFVETLIQESGLHVLRVEVRAGGEVPLHSHDCAATMVVIGGDALALGAEARRVTKGDVLVKSPGEAHGFSDVQASFVFISISDGEGIQQEQAWDMQYSR